MENSARNMATLYIYSNVLSVKEIIDKLGIEPSRSFEKGEPLSKRNPQKSKLRERSIWVLESDLEDEDYLGEHIDDLVSIIESKITNFEELVSDCEIRISCGFFAKDPDDKSAIFLDSSLLKRLTKIPLDIEIFLYAPSLEQD